MHRSINRFARENVARQKDSARPFRASVVIEPGRSRKLQEIRVEIRVHVKATVASRKDETRTIWSNIVPITELLGERTISLEGTIPDAALPTIELPHGRSRPPCT